MVVQSSLVYHVQCPFFLRITSFPRHLSPLLFYTHPSSFLHPPPSSFLHPPPLLPPPLPTSTPPVHAPCAPPYYTHRHCSTHHTPTVGLCTPMSCSGGAHRLVGWSCSTEASGKLPKCARKLPRSLGRQSVDMLCGGGAGCGGMCGREYWWCWANVWLGLRGEMDGLVCVHAPCLVQCASLYLV